MGRSEKTASDHEFYRAFCYALREEIMINWTASEATILEGKDRTAYYLSMEYMPGRLLQNNITNIGAMDLVKEVLKKMSREPTAVFALEPDIGIGNGGLGRLASCFLDSLATLRYPAIGYGMRYQYGIFEQEVWCGIQVERPDRWLLSENPWEFRRDAYAVSVKFGGKISEQKNEAGETVYEVIDCDEVRALPFDLPIIGYSRKNDFSVLTLRLWSTKESPRNFQLQKYNSGDYGDAAENTSLTDVLYPNDNHKAGKRIRLKQEFLLVSASLQDILHRHFSSDGTVETLADRVRIQINDTHPALVVPELQRLLMKNQNLSWDHAWEIVTTCCSYTNHTVLKEALEEWNEERLGALLPRQHLLIEQINNKLIDTIKKKFPGDNERLDRMSILSSGQIKMAHLAIFGSHKVNGVARLHSDIIKRSLFKDFAELFEERFTNVTNGVTQRRWLLNCNPKLASLITSKIGPDWVTDFMQLKKLAEFSDDPETQKAILNIKQENKEKYDAHLSEKGLLPADALYDVQIKRLHEYKRQLMNAIHTIVVYQQLKADPNSRKCKRMVLIGGKAAPGYQTAKDIIRLIYCLSRTINNDPDVNQKLKIQFIENYNVSEAERIIPAADLSEQILTAGMEASGTGNMKLSINGAMTIGTEDGANIEMREQVGDTWWPFSFGDSADNNAKHSRDGTYHPQERINEHPIIKNALNALIDGTFTENEAEEGALRHIFDTLVESQHGGRPDKYFILNDLPSYYETQLAVEELYSKPSEWAKYVIHNIAGMGQFSADISIRNYAENIWSIKPAPINSHLLEQIRNEYAELDRCRIL